MIRDLWNPTFIVLAMAFAAAPVTALAGWRRPDVVAIVAGLLSGLTFAALLWGWAWDAPVLDAAWAPTWGMRLTFGLDGLSLLYGMLASGIGLAVVVYSSAYLPRHLQHQHRPSVDNVRFYAFLMLFMGAMIGLVCARDTMLIFLFWDVTAIASFFLIGYDQPKAEARSAAMAAMLVTGGSAILLLAGAVILARDTGSFGLDSTFVTAATGRSTSIALALICVAGLAKSAQAPLHYWLPRAMAAPTPVSAYLHSAAMVAAGVFLISRFSPLLILSPGVRDLLVVIGFCSIAVGGVIALTRDVLKQLLAYSTISQYGYVVVMLGIGGKYGAAGACFYVIVHALAKSALFLTAGAVTEATGEKSLSGLGGLLRRMPALAAASGIAAATLAAFPLTSGFFKDELFFAAASERGTVVQVLAVGGAALTVAYMVTFWRGIFLGNQRADVAPIPGRLVWPVAVLSGFALIGGFWREPLIHLAEDAASATAGKPVELHLAYHLDTRPENVMAVTSILFGLALGATLPRWKQLPRTLASFGGRIGPARLHDQAVLGLNRISDQIHRLEVRDLRSRVATILLPAALLVGAGALAQRSFNDLQVGSFARQDLPLTLMVALAGCSALTATLTRNHLSLALVLSGAGYSLAVVYALFGAPDVALVAVLIETLFTLLFFGMLTLLPRDADPAGIRDDAPSRVHRPPESRRRRDRFIALLAAGLAFLVTWSVLSQPSGFESITVRQIELTPDAHGKDIVTVILADFRGLDTMGEITVMGIAFLGIATLLRKWRTS